MAEVPILCFRSPSHCDVHYCGMFRIQLSEPTLVHDLVDFLGRAECVALQAGRDAIEVHVLRPRRADQARRDLLGLLSAWSAMHPGVDAELAE